MKYFVTGATGFIGGRIARQLVEADHEVVALARNPARAENLHRLGVSVHIGDITDRESLRVPMTGVDGVFPRPGTRSARVTSARLSLSTSEERATSSK